MATQHTSFIQPHFLISHYQILLNSIQPFRMARTLREVLLTLCKNCILFVCACVHALVPGGEWILTQGQSPFLGEADFRPGVRLASSLPDKPSTWRALEGSLQCAPTQTSRIKSQFNSVIIECINKEAARNHDMLQAVWWRTTRPAQMRPSFSLVRTQEAHSSQNALLSVMFSVWSWANILHAA